MPFIEQTSPLSPAKKQQKHTLIGSIDEFVSDWAGWLANEKSRSELIPCWLPLFDIQLVLQSMKDVLGKKEEKKL